MSLSNLFIPLCFLPNSSCPFMFRYVQSLCPCERSASSELPVPLAPNAQRPLCGVDCGQSRPSLPEPLNHSGCYVYHFSTKELLHSAHVLYECVFWSEQVALNLCGPAALEFLFCKTRARRLVCVVVSG